MNVTNIYERNYSEIPYMQKKENVKYNLIHTVSNNSDYYGIEIISDSNDYKKDKVHYKNLSSSKTLIVNILKFLYENSVKLDASLAIISDMLYLIEKM